VKQTGVAPMRFAISDRTELFASAKIASDVLDIREPKQPGYFGNRKIRFQK
jgi:hypothetical protein